jgi:hypothetical protein
MSRELIPYFNITVLATPKHNIAVYKHMENSTITRVKSAIIGKAWANGAINNLMPANFTLTENRTFSAGETFLLGTLTLKMDRNLPFPVEMKTGEKFYFYPNSKREGFKDADLSISVLRTPQEADAIIEGTRAGMKTWRASH